MSRQIMVLLRTPANILDDATTYLNIYFLGLPFLFMYNVLSSMFNALGRSRIPLYLLIFSSVLNVALDIYMVGPLDMGVAGAAWATLLAQGISAVLSFCIFLKELKTYPGKPGGPPFRLGRAEKHGTRGLALHFAAVHRVHWHDAGAVRGEQLWLSDAGGLLGGHAH